MAYRLKTIRYQGTERRILLQNENGPCPLLAACNALLLRADVDFPPSCVRNSVASLDDVTNMLADQALRHLHSATSTTTTTAAAGDSSTVSSSAPAVQPQPQTEAGHHHHQQQQHHDADQQEHDYLLHELLTHIPTFQYGMDVNPSFTCGITGYEWTAQLSAFDVIRVKLVHGWLVDPSSQSEIYRAAGNECYNALVERIIRSREAEAELDEAQKQLAGAVAGAGAMTGVGTGSVEPLQRRVRELAEQVTRGTLIDDFLNASAHQLTDYGLRVLHEQVREGEMVVFFRNNHFGTLTKHKGLLYLLVTDLGYANTPDIVWEKLDVIDGDTELVNSEFHRAGEQSSLSDSLMSGPTLSPEQLLAQSSQTDADYHLALHLSMQDQESIAGGTTNQNASSTLDDEEGQLIAAATEESLRTYHGIAAPAQSASSQQPSQPDHRMDDASTSGAVTTLPPSRVAGAFGGDAGNGTVVSLPATAPVAAPGVGSIDPSRVTVAVGIPLGSTVNDTVQLMNRRAGSAPASDATMPPKASHGDEQSNADELLARQMQNEQEEASLHLARQLQAEEDRRGRPAQPPPAASSARPSPQRPAQRRPPRTTSSPPGAGTKDSSCVIS